MDYRECAKQIYSEIGGRKNLISAAHCATRLRLVIADNQKVNTKALENIDGVKGVFDASGQLQIIIGTGTVNKVYDELLEIAEITASTKEEIKQEAASKAVWWKRAIKTLGDIFVPIIPAIVATGLLCGLLSGVVQIWPQMENSGLYNLLNIFSNTALTFLSILIAISAAKIFGGNVYLGAVIGMIMIHPNLVNAWSIAGGAETETLWSWFGILDIANVGYQGHVIPVILSVWLMCTIEKWLHKRVPEMFDIFITPLCSVLVAGFFAMTVIGLALPSSLSAFLGITEPAIFGVNIR